MSKFIIVSILILTIFGTLGFFGFNVYSQFYGVPRDAPTGNYSFVVNQGDTISDIAQVLEADNVINSASSLIWLERLNSTNPLLEGEYTIELDDDSPEDILQKIDSQTIAMAKERQENTKPSKRITIREGLPLEQVFIILEENQIVSATKMREYALDPLNFDRNTFEFLPEPLNCNYGDNKTCVLYYPEGYVYPNTYDFFLESTPEEVFKVFLNGFNNQVWSKVEGTFGNQDFYEAVILASVIEKETGRPKTGITAENKDIVNQERQIMAGVFKNRTEIGMKWGSDVTIEYSTGRRVCQQTLEIEDCFFLDSPVAIHLYNTYQVDGAPIGPVTSPTFDTIFAALNPIESDNLFFVSDATGKKYFTTNETDFFQSIEDVKAINRSLGV